MEANIEACKVLQQDVFSLMVNFMLGVIALSSLLIKRSWFDRRKRSNWAFFYDVSKLFVSGMTGHMLNVILSHKLDDTGSGDECAYYLVNYLLDFVFGVPLTVYLLRHMLSLSHSRGWTSLQRRGHYNDSFSVWFKQTVEFTGIVAGVKLLLAVPLFVMQSQFQALGMVLVEPMQHNIQLELFAVMLVIPTLLNVIQFLLYDQILMLSETNSSPEHSETSSPRSTFSLDSPCPKDHLML